MFVADSEAAVEHANSGARAWLIPRPGLFEQLAAARRVVQVSAPAGSGKTFLLRSWIAANDLTKRTAWVSVARQEHDPQVFWLSVFDALRQTAAGSERVRELTVAPDLDGANVVGRLLEDLSSLREPLWLVIDDVHELQADEASRHLELLLGAAPPELRFVLLTRHDLRLGLHRLRVEGELTELRGEDLRFTLEQSRALLKAVGVRLSDATLESLVATTEGWAAGLRLAALSLARHPDPERSAVSFSGRERAVADYLLAEVLERQPAEVRQLLLRTSLLERVSGPLADRLTGSSGSYRILAGLEDAGAFVAAVDPERTWFRYHHLFGDLLALELHRTAPQEVPGLHTIAADWWADHGYPVEAIRHAQAAENWGLAARLLANNWFEFYFDGRLATRRELLSGFPANVVAADPELAVLAGADRRAAGSLQESERYLGLAKRMSATVREDRRARLGIALGFERFELARARNDLRSVTEEAQELLTSTETTELDLGEWIRIRVLTDLGIAEMWAGRLEDSERHLEQGLEEARQISKPMLELHALAHRALLSVFRSKEPVEPRAMQAIELARKHGWEETATATAAAYVALGGDMVWQGRLEEAELWLDLAQRVLGHDTQPTAAMLHAARGLLAFARGQETEAATAYRDAERMERLLVMPHIFTARVQALKLRMLVRLGETEQVEQALAEMDQETRETSQMRVVLSALELRSGDPEAAADILAALLKDPTPVMAPIWQIEALLLEAIARDALRDPAAASRALERALDIAEPSGLLLPFLLYPAAELLQRQTRLRTTHPSLIAEILNLLSGHTPAARPKNATPIQEPLSESELRVLRYLPTNLPAPEIAAELFVSLNTIRTHLRNVYTKLDVHSRADAVKRARDLGLLSPSSRKL